MSEVFKPPIKWVGGKSSLIQQIQPLFPRDIATFYEPFLGGFSVAQHVQADRFVLSDANPLLIDLCRAISMDWEGLADETDQIFSTNSKDQYLKIRALGDWTPAQFLYLNRASWRGLWRLNKSGQMNTPYGEGKIHLVDRVNMRKMNQWLNHNDVELVHKLWAIPKEAGPTDFFYFDPPYDGTWGGYTPNGFSSVQANFFRDCLDLADRGIPWVMSNSDTPEMRGVFRDFEIKELSTNRSINSKKRVEIVIINRGRQ